MRKVALSGLREDLPNREDLPKYLRISEEEEYQLENDPRFLARIEESRREFREGRGVRLEDIED